MEVHKEVDAPGSCARCHPAGEEGAVRYAKRPDMKVLATDPGSQRDFAAFSKQTGNELVESTSHDKVFTFLMRRR